MADIIAFPVRKPEERNITPADVVRREIMLLEALLDRVSAAETKEELINAWRSHGTNLDLWLHRIGVEFDRAVLPRLFVSAYQDAIAMEAIAIAGSTLPPTPGAA